MSSLLCNDSYFGFMFSTPEISSIFSDSTRTQIWMDVEVALAIAEEEAGIIPSGTAEKIKEAARVDRIDFESMRKGFEQAGFPVIPFVKEFMKICEPEAAKWIHYGATSQDIQDTGHAIQMKKGFECIEKDLLSVLAFCRNLAIKHRNTVMAGRSFQQHAAPVTFGFKVAVWLEELLRHYERLQEILPRVLIGQCSGAVGTLATLGEKGPAVRESFMRNIGLNSTEMPWHTSRDGMAEAIHWLALCTATMAKMANEIAILMRTEIDELREPYAQGRGGSSTMPQKRNPVMCEPIIAIAHRLRELSSSQLTAMVQEHERGVGHMHLEWLIIPEAFNLAAASFSHMIKLLDGLCVNEVRMKENLEQGGGYIMAEAVMMGLAEQMGRMVAHEKIAEIARKGRETGISLREALLSDDALKEIITESQIDTLLNPLQYTGSLQHMIDAVLTKAVSVIGEEQ